MTAPVNSSDDVDINNNTNTEQQPNNNNNTNEQPTTQVATNQEYLSSSSSPLPQGVLDSKALNQMPANSRQSIWVSSHPLTQPPSSEQISQPTTTKTTRISSTRAMNNNKVNKKNVGHHHPSSSLSVDTTMMRPQQQQQQHHHSKSQSVPSSPIHHSTTSSFNNSSSVSLPSSPTATPTTTPTTTTTTPASSTTTTTTISQQAAQQQKQSSSSSSASQQQQQQKEEKKYSDHLYGAIPTIVQNTTQQQNGLEAIIQYFNHRSQLENDYSLELKKMSQSFSLGGAQPPLTSNNNNANSTSHDHASSTTTATTTTSATTSAAASMGFTGQLAQVVNGMKNMSERLSLRHSNFSKDIQFCMCGPLSDFNNDLGMSKKRLLNAAQQLDKDLMIGLNAVEKNKHRQHRVAKEAEDTIIKAQKAIQKAMSSNNGDEDNDCTLSSSPSTTNSTIFHYENNKWKQMTEKAVRDAKIADMQYSDTVTQMRLYQQRFKDDMGNILNSFQSNDIQLLQICKTFLNHYISFEEQLVRDFQKDLEVLRNAVNQIDVSETVDQFIVANQTNQRAPDLIPYEPYLSPYLNSNRKDDVPSSQSYSSSPSNNASSVSHHGSFSSPSKSGPIVKPQKPRGLSTTSSTRENTFVIPTRKSTRSNAELSAAMNNANNPNNGAIPSKGQRLQKWFHNFTNNQLKLLPRSAPDGDAFETMHEVMLTKPSRPLPPLPTEEEDDDLPTNPTTTETMSSSIASASLDATTNTDTTSDVSSTATSNTAEDKKEADLSGINAEDQQLLKDIMSNFDDQEFRRDRLDIQEVKAYEALLTRVFAIGELSEEDQDELVTQVNELSDKLELPASMGTRLALAMAMNHIRADPCIENAKAFTIVAQLVTTAMERSHEYGDANVGRLFLNMSQTFYRKKRNGSEETQEYLQQYLRDLLVWKDIRFWEGAFFDALSYERKKSEWNAQKKWRYLDKEQRAEVVVQHENMVFGLLGSFAFNMLNMGVAVQDCRLFMEKMCMINSLKDEYTELLMNNIDTTYIAIRAAEETPSSSASSNTRGRTVSMPTVPRSPARPRANANILVEEENQTVYLSDSETNSDEFDSNGSFVASSSFVFPSFKENYFQPNTRAT